jgi:hypothetical protein
VIRRGESMSNGEADEPETDAMLELWFREGNEAVVCMGDDQPEPLTKWIGELIDRHRHLFPEAEEQGHDPFSRGIPRRVEQFVSAIGIGLRAKTWTGTPISGTWHQGWVTAGAEGEVRAEDRQIRWKPTAFVDGSER